MNVYILGFDQAYAISLVSLLDILNQAKTFLLSSQQPSTPQKMSIKLVSVDGKPILCQNNILLNVNGALEDIQEADILMITAIHDIEADLSKYRFISDWLKTQYEKGTALASVCTGAFLLAEAGLLDGMDATTHWTVFDEFSERYPKIQLQSEEFFIDNGDIYCAGGHSSAIDLVYFLIEKNLGHALAARTAKFFLHDLRRVSQQTYAIFDDKTEHNDSQILKAQRWIKSHLTEPLNINELIKMACMSLRTFERHFKKATGSSPQVYLQRLRVESAKQLLETTNDSFDEISFQMGYKNSGSFRKIFVRWVKLLPSEYRQRFRAYGQE